MKGCAGVRYEVMAQWEAEKWSSEELSERCVLISITDPNPSEAPIFSDNEQIKGILKLEFQDIHEIIEGYDFQLLTIEQVQLIQQFVDCYKSEIDAVVVHCHAGVCRSAAICGAIALYLGDSDDFIWQGSHLPNKYCFELCNDTLDLGLSVEMIKDRYSRMSEAFKNKSRTNFKTELDSEGNEVLSLVM